MVVGRGYATAGSDKWIQSKVFEHDLGPSNK